MNRTIYSCLVACFIFISCDTNKPSNSPSSGSDPVMSTQNGNKETPPAPPQNQEQPPLPGSGTPPPGQTNGPNKPPAIDRSNLPKDCYDAAKADAKMMCPDLYEPVCGCDGVNYSNECEAKKLGVLKWTAGRCK
jgi:hypothetical protein